MNPDRLTDCLFHQTCDRMMLTGAKSYLDNSQTHPITKATNTDLLGLKLLTNTTNGQYIKLRV